MQSLGTVDELVAQARARTGLDDLGSDSYREGLAIAVASCEADGWLNDLGVTVFREQLIGFLSIRLSVEDWYRRHPEIDDQEIVAPLFGLGLPRTGSTALSYLQAQDPRTRSLLAWEASMPTPPPEPDTYTTDPRIAQIAEQTAFMDQVAPRFKGMLPSEPDGPTECLQLLALDFRSAMLMLTAGAGYQRWLTTCDMTPAYEYHRRVLKLLQWKLPTRPWRLKTPAHLQGIAALTAVYPDARFVMTHRDIAQVIPSVVSLHDAMSEMIRAAPLPPDFAAREAGFWEHGLRTTVAFRDAGNEARFFDIGFADLQRDPVGQMERLYAWTGDDLTPEVAERMRSWWTSNPADKHGVHEYRPEDYGIDVDALRRQFAFYDDRFIPPAPEPT